VQADGDVHAASDNISRKLKVMTALRRSFCLSMSAICPKRTFEWTHSALLSGVKWTS